jgi:hypothetical protein
MISITPMTRCPLPDQRKIYRPAAICIAKGNLSLQNAKAHRWPDRRVMPDKRGSIKPNDCFYFFSPSRISIIFRKNSLLL